MNNLLNLLRESKIVIPPIQRDYAQGRNTGKIPTIRERFLDNIVEVLTNEEQAPMELDFIYGYTETDSTGNYQVSIFKPLDGQQRLTTLFLIHWFVANKEKVNAEDVKPLLSKFSYSTRKTSRSFCEKLIDFKIDWTDEKKVDEQIVNQSWFYSNWKNDPTIQSMLVVLRTIQDKFEGLNNLWDKLSGENPRIVFHLLSMNDLGLPDDLYIKMNARGKPLTDFEHFKSSFSEILDEEKAKYFNEKVDGEWSDLFWGIFKDRETKDVAKLVDAGFLSFFWYITDILIKKQGIVTADEFWLKKVNNVYSENDENVQFLFDCIDLFLKLSREVEHPLDSIFYTADDDFVITKTKLFFKNANSNLFHKCVETYQNNFVIREQLLLYAFIKINLDKVKVPSNFYRLTRNLLEHASDKQVRNENLNNLYSAIEALINGERLPENLPFTHRQLNEEAAKEALLETNPELIETIYKLEDHTLLRGSIGVFSLDTTIGDLGVVFLKEFYADCNFIEISKALLTFGFYPQFYGVDYMRFGNKNNPTWREILNQSDNRIGFDNTRNILQQYLNFRMTYPDINNLDITNNYMAKTTAAKDLRYYYLKYDSFHLWNEHQTDGFYWWQNYTEEPYKCIMLFRTNFRGRSWSPFLLEINKRVDECTIENYGSNLQFTKDNLILLISHANNGFVFSSPVDDQFSLDYLNRLILSDKLDDNGCLLVNQDISGVDTFDRIGKCIDFLKTL
jgi:hypothetical protein